MKRIFTAIALAIAILSLIAQPALASWYAGYFQGGGSYGVRADIYTPASAPYIGATGGESNWVSTATPWVTAYWVQTGWRLTQAAPTTAKSYYEYRASPDPADYLLVEYENHSWGTSKNYKIEWDGTYWIFYRNGTWLFGVTGGYLPTPPTTVAAESEVHNDPTTVLDTHFGNVQWKNSGGTWADFSQWWNYSNQDPYSVQFTLYPSNFNTYGP